MKYVVRIYQQEPKSFRSIRTALRYAAANENENATTRIVVERNDGWGETQFDFVASTRRDADRLAKQLDGVPVEHWNSIANEFRCQV